MKTEIWIRGLGTYSHWPCMAQQSPWNALLLQSTIWLMYKCHSQHLQLHSLRVSPVTPKRPRESQHADRSQSLWRFLYRTICPSLLRVLGRRGWRRSLDLEGAVMGLLEVRSPREGRKGIRWREGLGCRRSATVRWPRWVMG